MITVLGFTQEGSIMFVPADAMPDFDKGYQGSAKLLSEMVNGDRLFEAYFTDRSGIQGQPLTAAPHNNNPAE